MNIRQKAFVFEIHPNKEQRQKLMETFGNTRAYWNTCVYNFNNQLDHINSTNFRNEVDKEFRLNISAASIQQTERNFIEFKKQFFNKKRKTKVGRPKFKRKGSKQSFRLSNQDSNLRNNKIWLVKIGYVKINNYMEIPENSRHINTTVKLDSCGKFYVSLLYEVEINHLPKTNKVIGIDLGIKQFAILSNGEFVENFKYFQEGLDEIKKIQIYLSRKQIGSKRYERCRLKLAKLHKQITNRRDHFQHVLSKYLVTEFDMICLENLSVEELKLKSSKLMSRYISDVSWSSFINKLKYKAEWYGKYIYQVDKWFSSTQICRCCGNKQKLKLSDRIYECNVCDLVIDRDLNASQNILKESRRNSYGLTNTERTNLNLLDDDLLVSVDLVKLNLFN